MSKLSKLQRLAISRNNGIRFIKGSGANLRQQMKITPLTTKEKQDLTKAILLIERVVGSAKDNWQTIKLKYNK